MTDPTLPSPEDHLDGTPFDQEPTEAAEVRVQGELDTELAKHLLGGRSTSDIGQTRLAARAARPDCRRQRHGAKDLPRGACVRGRHGR